METDLPLKCACGTLQGTVSGVSPRTVGRLLCYCDDCQAFARWLGAADRALDEHGGTDITQVSQATVRFVAGAEQLAAIRLTPTGMIRWYAACCRTPVGNTMGSPAAPFVGLISTFVDHAGDGRIRDEVFGPIRGRGFGRFAKGPVDAPDRPPLRFLARAVLLLLRWRLRGDHRQSAFFPAGAPRVVPEVLSLEAREALRDAL